MDKEFFIKALQSQVDVLEDFNKWFETKTTTDHRLKGCVARDPLKPFLKKEDTKDQPKMIDQVLSEMKQAKIELGLMSE